MRNIPLMKRLLYLCDLKNVEGVFLGQKINILVKFLNTIEVVDWEKDWCQISPKYWTFVSFRNGEEI